jgi:homoserine kinase
VCLIRSYDPLDIVQIPVRGRIVWAVVTPDLQVNTREARQMLPAEVPFRQTVRQMGNLAGLTLGLARGDAQLVGRSVEDVIVEPVRARLIPGFHEVKAAAMAAGALGCSISGSGPTMFAVTDTIFSARRINRAMSDAFREAAGLKSTTRVSRVNRYGATILAEAAE